MPQAVLDECLADPCAPGAQAILETSRKDGFALIPDGAIKELDSAYALGLGLGSGEVAVLSYALQHSQVALVDERRARRIAQQLGVSVAGSDAILMALKKSGAVSTIRPALLAWYRCGYFFSPALQKQLLAVAGELT